MPWYRGNLHTHTLNSDGVDAPDVVARHYRELGYQFVVITDHDYVTDADPLNALLGCDERFLVLPGQEITQFIGEPEHFCTGSAHVNALFTTEVIDPVGELGGARFVFRGGFAPAGTPVAETFRANIDAVLARGGVAQVNHPNFLWNVAPEDLDDVPDGTLLEVWNACGGANNLGGVSPSEQFRPSIESFWDRALSRGQVIWGTGVDDSHSAPMRGLSWVTVRAPNLSADALAAALRAGDFYAVAAVGYDKNSPGYGIWIEEIAIDEEKYELTLRRPAFVTPDFLTRFIGLNGAILAEERGVAPSYRFTGDETYVRAAITDSEGNRAWTQPAFRDGRTGESLRAEKS